jgi:hypothetical protein
VTQNPYQPPTPYEATLAEAVPSGATAAAMRQSVAVFRGLLLLYPTLIVAIVVFTFALESYLPEELRLYEEAQVNLPFSAATVAVEVFATFCLCLDFAGWLGMLFFWRPSRWIFLASQLLFLVVTALWVPSATHNITDAADSASLLVAGATLAMAFFSPVREQFIRRKSTL